MRKSFFNAGAKAFLIALLQGTVTEAAEVKVLCSNASAIVLVMNELVPQFERATGHNLTIRYDFGPTLNREIEAGAVFDVAILSLDVEGLIKYLVKVHNRFSPHAVSLSNCGGSLG